MKTKPSAAAAQQRHIAYLEADIECERALIADLAAELRRHARGSPWLQVIVGGKP